MHNNLSSIQTLFKYTRTEYTAGMPFSSFDVGMWALLLYRRHIFIYKIFFFLHLTLSSLTLWQNSLFLYKEGKKWAVKIAKGVCYQNVFQDSLFWTSCPSLMLILHGPPWSTLHSFYLVICLEPCMVTLAGYIYKRCNIAQFDTVFALLSYWCSILLSWSDSHLMYRAKRQLKWSVSFYLQTNCDTCLSSIQHCSTGPVSSCWMPCKIQVSTLQLLILTTHNSNLLYTSHMLTDVNTSVFRTWTQSICITFMETWNKWLSLPNLLTQILHNNVLWVNKVSFDRKVEGWRGQGRVTSYLKLCLHTLHIFLYLLMSLAVHPVMMALEVRSLNLDLGSVMATCSYSSQRVVSLAEELLSQVWCLLAWMARWYS